MPWIETETADAAPLGVLAAIHSPASDVASEAAKILAARFRRNLMQWAAHVDDSSRAAAPPGRFDA